MMLLKINGVEVIDTFKFQLYNEQGHTIQVVEYKMADGTEVIVTNEESTKCQTVH